MHVSSKVIPDVMKFMLPHADAISLQKANFKKPLQKPLSKASSKRPCKTPRQQPRPFISRSWQHARHACVPREQIPVKLLTQQFNFRLQDRAPRARPRCAAHINHPSNRFTSMAKAHR
jgi:hypothetical protein